MKTSLSRLAIISSLLILSFLVSMNVTASNPKAPDFSLKTDTNLIHIKDLQGKVVYLDFWASWCVPCRKSFPWMNEMQAKYKDKGLVILAINLDKKSELVAQFLKKYPAKFKIAYDPEGISAQEYKVMGMPSSYLIDRRGNIVETHIGFREKDKAELESHISNLL